MMNENETYSYGNDPRYLTVRQIRKQKWKEHPIRTFLCLPIAFVSGLWQSSQIMVDKMKAFIGQCLVLWFALWLLYTLGPLSFLLGLFVEGHRNRLFGFRPLLLGMGIGSVLVCNETLTEQEFMPWHTIYGFISQIDLPDATISMITKVIIFLMGISIFVAACIFLLYGALSHIAVAIVGILLFAEGCLAIHESELKIGSYLKLAWKWPVWIWNFAIDNIKFFFNLLRYFIPFYNIIVQDEDDYFFARMHRLL